MKQESEEKRAKRKLSEAKELARLEKMALKPLTTTYLPFLMVILTIIYVVDELASSMNSAIQPYMILDLFKIPNGDINDPAYANAVTLMTPFTLIGYCFMMVTPFYKALADKLGRRLFLILNTLIMGLGLFVCMIAPHWAVYILGILMITFVQTNDVQVTYIMETAPAKHRAKLCSITKAIALASCSLIGVARSIFYTPEVPSSWRWVIFIPAVLGIGVSLLSIPFTKETPVFMKSRMDYLNKSDEQRAAEAAASAEAAAQQKGGVFQAIKYIFTHKQLRNIVIAGIVFCIATGVTSHYAEIVESSKELGLYTTENINTFMIIFPLVNAVFTLCSGFISDWLGRKKSCVVLCAFAAATLAGFALGAKFGMPIWLVSVFYGAFIGTLWSVSDTLVIVMPGESSPTELRSAVIGSISLLLAVGTVISMVAFLVGINIVGASGLGMLSMVICFPCLLLAVILIAVSVKETAGADLTAIGHEETKE